MSNIEALFSLVDCESWEIEQIHSNYTLKVTVVGIKSKKIEPLKKVFHSMLYPGVAVEWNFLDVSE